MKRHRSRLFYLSRALGYFLGMMIFGFALVLLLFGLGWLIDLIGMGWALIIGLVVIVAAISLIFAAGD